MSVMNPSNERPIFVGGVPKSGTTLVGQLLSNHSSISIDFDIDPTIHFLKYVKNVRRDCFSNMCWGNNEFRVWDEMNVDYFHKLHQSWKNQICRWGSSTCYTYLYRDIVCGWFPMAQFIIVRRDPRDLWCSYKQQHNPYIPDPIDRWNYFVTRITNLPKPGNDKRIIQLEYHEVVRDPSIVFIALELDVPRNYTNGTRNVLFRRSLGLTSDEAIRAVCGNSIITSRVGRWRRDLSEEEIRRCNEVFPELCDYYDNVSEC